MCTAPMPDGHCYVCGRAGASPVKAQASLCMVCIGYSVELDHCERTGAPCCVPMANRPVYRDLARRHGADRLRAIFDGREPDPVPFWVSSGERP